MEAIRCFETSAPTRLTTASHPRRLESFETEFSISRSFECHRLYYLVVEWANCLLPLLCDVVFGWPWLLMVVLYSMSDLLAFCLVVCVSSLIKIINTLSINSAFLWQKSISHIIAVHKLQCLQASTQRVYSKYTTSIQQASNMYWKLCPDFHPRSCVFSFNFLTSFRLLSSPFGNHPIWSNYALCFFRNSIIDVLNC